MRHWVPIGLAVVAAAVIGAGCFFFWPASLEPVAVTRAFPSGADLVARGEYLTKAGDCAACHTVPGGTPFAGGLAFKLPFGTIYSPNITPDKDAGIGNWSDAEFVRAMRKGIGRHGEDLYPAFPYTSYALASTEDIIAIRAYLATLSPEQTQPPANDLIFPFNQRALMRGWKFLFLPHRPFEPDPSRSAEWNRGAYLVESLGHCGECHTPRNLLFARKSDDRLAGAIVEGQKAYNITPDNPTGIGNWTEDELAAYLSTGHADGHGSASGGMAEVVDLSLRFLSPADIRSMVTYLRAVPSRATALEGPLDANPSSLASATGWSPSRGTPSSPGLKVFEAACASCHAWDGSGREVAHASLQGARTVNDPDGANLVRVILHGSHIGSAQGDLMMPGFAEGYSDAEIAAVSNYVIGQFGGSIGKVTETDVATARKD
jgi:mono/diheme cytochrome c family protein